MKHTKDWIGNKKATFAQLGASNHSESEREENDFYSTDPNSLKIFLNALKRDGFICIITFGNVLAVRDIYRNY